MSNNSYNIGYNDTSYESISNWDYKKKRPFKEKSLKINNFNILLFTSLILITIYIPLNYCIFNFNIPTKYKKKYNNTDLGNLDKEYFDEIDNKNFCQKSIIYIFNFKNVYISYIFYFSIFFIILYLLYISSVFTYLFQYIIKPNISSIIGCSYEFKDSMQNIQNLIKKKQYNKLIEIIKIIIYIFIIILFIIAFFIFIFASLYNYYIKIKIKIKS